MTAREVKDRLHADSASVKNGVYTVRYGFFYTHGRTSEDVANHVRRFRGATVLDHGEVWKPFRGSAPVARQSHWWVTFTLPAPTLTPAQVDAVRAGVAKVLDT